MLKKIICIILVLSLFVSIGTSLGKIVKNADEKKIYPLDDVHIISLKDNAELLTDIENEPLTTIKSGSKGDCAVIIKQFMPHSLGYCMEITCEYAITVLQNRGYENILYIDSPTIYKLKNNMLDFIKDNLGSKNKLFIFLFGHGNTNIIQLNPLQLLRANKFKSIINDISPRPSINTIFIESCYCGSFIDELSGSNRIIITSTDSDSTAYGSHTGYSIFSGKLYESLNAGKNLAESWEDADSYLASNFRSFRNQNPQIEDTGNEHSVGTYKVADNLPMHDGHESNPNNKDGKSAEQNFCRTKKNTFNLIEIFSLLKIMEKIPIIQKLLSL
jgi:hypothetical protein